MPTLERILIVAVSEIMQLELQALGDHCIASQLRPIVLAACIAAQNSEPEPGSPAAIMRAHLAEFGR